MPVFKTGHRAGGGTLQGAVIVARALLVWLAGFEPASSRTRSERSTKLNYSQSCMSRPLDVKGTCRSAARAADSLPGMLLSDRDLRLALAEGRLEVGGALPPAVQPSSIDVRLGSKFRVFDTHRHTVIDPRLRVDDLTTLVEVPAGEAFVLHPGQFVLGVTLERIQLADDLAGRIEGKSSLGRLGLLVHSTAGFIDPGFHGRVTLELSNINRLPILLWPGMFIGQLCVFQMTSAAEVPYGSATVGSRYQGQDEPTASRSYLNT